MEDLRCRGWFQWGHDMAAMNINFEPDLIGVMSQFQQFDDILKKHIAIATEKAASKIGSFQVDYMWANFKDPKGPLEEAVGVRIVHEYMAWIGPDPGEAASVYAWRRDRGFVGKFDSLGRGPFTDIGIRYAEESILDDAVLFDVAEQYIEAIYAAWEECIGALPQGTSANMTKA